MAAFRHNLVLLLPILLWAGCRLNNKYLSKSAKSSSDTDNDLPEVNLVAYHINDSLTEIFYEIKNQALLYRRPDTSRAFYADLQINYELLAEADSKKVYENNSVKLYDRSEEEIVQPRSLRVRFKVKAQLGNNYFLGIETLDRNKKTRHNSSININKQNVFNSQNFLITLRDTVAFKSTFQSGETIVVKFRNPGIKQVTVDCFFKEFGPAAPPFSVKPYNENKFSPDSSFQLNLNTNSFIVTMPYQGFYHIRPGSGSEGLSLFTYDNSFPGLGNSQEMINSTRYIMERTEFENCKTSPEPKAAIDNFWLTLGGSNERARELLKRYYSRVMDANKFYTSYTHGWKSDRGMIFIVFGPPTNLYKSKKDEIWVYGNETNPAALRFIFNKTSNPFSDNDYVLERSQYYKDAWYTAVEYWRQGAVYVESRR